MSFSLGIVGLPNVGKSTLFNALVRNVQAEASNYPFCTIDPNVGVVEVPDARLEKLGAIDKTQKIIPTVIEFVDIAGLVKGASENKGKGNAFLSNIREVDAILHVVRMFEDGDIMHVDGSVDAERDRETIEMELLLADLQMGENALQKAVKQAKSGDKEWIAKRDLLEKCVTALQEEKMVRELDFDDDEKVVLKQYNFLTLKPILYVVNLSEAQLKNMPKIPFSPAVTISAQMEVDLISFSDEEMNEYLGEYNLSEPGLHRLIKESYKLLNLETFFTSGEKETRAWTVSAGSSAPEAAGVIHTDFKNNFIRAEVVSYDDYITHNGFNGAKEHGALRIEGKDYVVKDGDVMYFRTA